MSVRAQGHRRENTRVAVMISNRVAFFGELIAATLCIFSLGCGGDSSTSSSPPQPIAVSVTPQTATVVPGVRYGLSQPPPTMAAARVL